MNNLKARLLGLYDLFPFHEHPLWRAVKGRHLSLEELMRAEVQHWLRTRAGQPLRQHALNSARNVSPEIFDLLLQTYLEECTHDTSGPSHLELVERLVSAGGYTKDDLEQATFTPGNAAAIALYKHIGERGAACHMLGAGAVEHYYSRLCPDIYKVYTERYHLTVDQAETYRIHGPMDATHADRAFAILDIAINQHGLEVVESSVRDAFVATSLHYDGMLQAATGKIAYWDGTEK